MKKYQNISQTSQRVQFIDGDAVFLRRGGEFQSTKKATSVPDGVVVTPVATEKKKKKKTTENIDD